MCRFNPIPRRTAAEGKGKASPGGRRRTSLNGKNKFIATHYSGGVRLSVSRREGVILCRGGEEGI